MLKKIRRLTLILTMEIITILTPSKSKRKLTHKQMYSFHLQVRENNYQEILFTILVFMQEERNSVCPEIKHSSAYSVASKFLDCPLLWEHISVKGATGRPCKEFEKDKKLYI